MKKLFSKSLIIGLLTALILASYSGLLRGKELDVEKLDVETLNKIIESKKKRWIARETSKSSLSLEQKRNLCGVIRRRWSATKGSRQPEDPNRLARLKAGYLKAKRYPGQKPYLEELGGGSAFSTLYTLPQEQVDEAAPLTGQSTAAIDLPPYFDWRSKDRINWTTSIKNQGPCGSCWAHASIAVMETMIKIGLDNPDLDLDFSEQFMISCSEGGCGGWFMDSSAAFLKSTGVPREECFPYVAQDVACDLRCSDWQEQIEKIPDWNWVSGFPQVVNPTLIKQKLLKGPLLVAMTVYDDFMYYSRGAYEHVKGYLIGDHAVVLMGWDDKDRCWICKNSWGRDWGESGWFRIRMGKNECGIEDSLIYYSTPIAWNCDLEEGFEGRGENLPPGWERKVNNANYSWKISTSPVYEGRKAISIEFDPGLRSQDEVLISQTIQGADLAVAFAFMGSYYWGVAQHHYQISLWAVRGEWDGGVGDDILITENILEDHLDYDDESWTWIPVRYRLPPEVDHTPIRLAFRYRGTDGAQFCLDKICIEGLEDVGCACSSDDSGTLDIGQGRGSVDIRIQNAPRQVDSFGYDILYNASLTSYLGFEPGQRFQGPGFLSCQEIRVGQIHCSGSASSASTNRGGLIPAGYSGTMLTLRFSPIDRKAKECSLCFENLEHDIVGWRATNGCLLPAEVSSCVADVNGDGQITPQDALCLYEKSTNTCPTTFCGSCSEICCDMDMDGECTTSDIMFIFQKYLMKK